MTGTGFQVSSVKPYLTTPQGVLESFHKLADIGYRTVQVQWVDPSVPDEWVAEALRRSGLRCVSAQDRFETVQAHWDRWLCAMDLWEAETLCVSGIPDALRSAEGAAAFAKTLRNMAAVLEARGKKLSFHPLAADFACLPGGSAVDRLLDEGPHAPDLTLCVYHAVRAGLAPQALLTRYGSRVTMAHFKDYVLNAQGQAVLTPVGQGLIDWPDIARACQKAGVRWAFAEQESWEKDAFDCAGESYQYMTGLGLSADEPSGPDKRSE